MKLTRESLFFSLILIFGIVVFILSIYDVMLDKGFIVGVIAAYVILIALTIFFKFFRFGRDKISINTIEDFEKKLKGGLFHFKCPTCAGIFAIKKSKRNDEKPIKMTCPDCGAVGMVPSNPVSIFEEIPEKKSLKANFQCTSCSEGITVWAEGTDLYKNTNVFTCPFCGQEQTMDRV